MHNVRGDGANTKVSVSCGDVADASRFLSAPLISSHPVPYKRVECFSRPKLIIPKSVPPASILNTGLNLATATPPNLHPRSGFVHDVPQFQMDAGFYTGLITQA